MKKKLLLLLTGLFLTTGFIKAQCTNTISPQTVYGTPGSYAISTGTPLYVQVCSNVIVYDTLASTQRKYYLMPGAGLVIKGTFSHYIYMQAGSSLTRLGTTGNSNYVFYEPGSAITGTFALITASCAAVSFPTLACTATGIVDHSKSDLVSVYPNPAKNYMIVKSDHTTTLNGVLINALGQTEKTYAIENGKNTVDLTSLNEGIYFLMLTDKNKTLGYTKVVITR